MKKIIHSNNAPAAIGPYSQAVLAGNTLYISGQLGLDVKTGEFAGATVVEQAVCALNNASEILKEAGYTFDDVVKTTVLLKDIKDFAAANEVYAKYFTKDYPARAAYEVANLPKGGLIEIELIAYK